MPVIVRNPDDLVKFRSMREEGKYEVALNRLYNLRSRWISGRTLVGNLSLSALDREVECKMISREPGYFSMQPTSCKCSLVNQVCRQTDTEHASRNNEQVFITVLAVMISDKEKPTDVDEALAAIARHGISTVPVPRQVLFTMKKCLEICLMIPFRVSTGSS